MASEIEVVEEEVETRDQIESLSLSNGGAATGTGGATEVDEDSLRNDVYTAAAYGDMEKLQRLVETEGCSVSEPDSIGYYALQWAALNNRTAAALYIIEHGGDVNAADHTGQTALHWSAVRGGIQVAELLLKEGARVNAADMYGYQATHVAAQYGQTSFLYYIVSKWDADPDIPDNDGRSPLHWAAYKGYADCIRLLIFLDAYRGRQDKEGCTPLHWAAIRGHLEACTVLVQAGKKEDLMLTDNTGLTPAQLASDKNHRQVAFFLGNARKLLDKRFDGNSRFGRLSKLGLAPLLWCTLFVLLVTYMRSVIIATNLPKLTAGFSLLAWLGALLATLGSIFFYRCSSNDPGYIKMNMHDSRNTKDEEPLLKIEVNHPALLAGNWSQLCSTCKIVKPLRAKHCSTCDRCVEQFDHHCPWVSNCIGKKNKRDFFWFLILEVSAMLITGAVSLIRVVTDPLAPSSLGGWVQHAGTQHVGAVLFIIIDVFLLSGVVILTIVQASQISRNITTNEVANVLRYSYLRGAGGRFRNPYDYGCKKNCSDLLINGYNEDIEMGEEESLLSSSSSEQQGIGMMQITRNPSSHHNHNLHYHHHHHHHQEKGNGNGDVVINMNNNSSGCGSKTSANGVSHNKNNGNHKKDAKNESVPVGLGIGLGGARNTGRSFVSSGPSK